MNQLKDTILESALDILMKRGLKGWTMGDTAVAANTSKGLVHYHFSSRNQFLGEILKVVDLRRRKEMTESLTNRSGTAALDALWVVIESQVTNGLFGSWLDLSRELEIVDQTRPDWYQELTWEVSRSLGIDEAILRPASQFIASSIDGFQLQLLMGSPSQVIRHGYDRMWAAALAS